MTPSKKPYKAILNYPSGVYRVWQPWWKRWMKKKAVTITKSNVISLALEAFPTKDVKDYRDVIIEIDYDGGLMAYLRGKGRIWRQLWLYGEYHPVYYIEAYDLADKMLELIKESVKHYGFPEEEIEEVFNKISL